MLVAYIHHWHSEMAAFRGHAGPALDHAFAAQGAIAIMRRHSSARLGHMLTQARKRLEPWSGNTYVRDLDERLRAAAVV